MKKLAAIFLLAVTLCSCGAPAVPPLPPLQPPLPAEEAILPQIPIEDTEENRQAAIVETALAYYRKNPYVQYDNASLCVLGDADSMRTSCDDGNTPEMASADESVYHVCVSYTYHCVYHTYGYKLLGGLDKAYVNQVALADGLEDVLLFRYKNDPKNPAANRKAARELQKMLQPGDVITFFRYKGTGHSVLWAGDLNGDGKADLLNSDGEYYNAKTAADMREKMGGIDMNTDRFKCPSGEYFLFDPKCSQYLPKADYYSVLRFSDKPDLAPLTESAKTRLLFPGLEITYRTDVGNYGAVSRDGELTYTLTLRNHSDTDHEGILVQIPAPVNSCIVSVDGTLEQTALLKRTLSVPAGGKTVLKYTVKPAAEPGNVITAKGGYVHAIALPELTTAVQRTDMDGDALKKAIAAVTDKKGTEFVNAVYESAGVTLKLPEGEALRAALFTEEPRGDAKLYRHRETAAQEHDALKDMCIPGFYGGYYTATDKTGRRVKEVRAKDLQAGDILLWQAGVKDGILAAVHDGRSLCHYVNGTLKRMSQADLDRFLRHRWFIALRPLQTP